MKKNTTITACVILACALTAQGRKWTSAGSSSRSFEADFVSAADGKVTVKRKTGHHMTFELGKLSKADQEFVTNEVEARKAAAAADPLKDAAVPNALAGKLVRRSGGLLKSYEFASQGAAPKYYLLYYSASW